VGGLYPPWRRYVIMVGLGWGWWGVGGLAEGGGGLARFWVGVGSGFGTARGGVYGGQEGLPGGVWVCRSVGGRLWAQGPARFLGYDLVRLGQCFLGGLWSDAARVGFFSFLSVGGSSRSRWAGGPGVVMGVGGGVGGLVLCGVGGLVFLLFCSVFTGGVGCAFAPGPPLQLLAGRGVGGPGCGWGLVVAASFSVPDLPARGVVISARAASSANVGVVLARWLVFLPFTRQILWGCLLRAPARGDRRWVGGVLG